MMNSGFIKSAASVWSLRNSKKVNQFFIRAKYPRSFTFSLKDLWMCILIKLTSNLWHKRLICNWHSLSISRLLRVFIKKKWIHLLLTIWRESQERHSTMLRNKDQKHSKFVLNLKTLCLLSKIHHQINYKVMIPLLKKKYRLN